MGRRALTQEEKEDAERLNVAWKAFQKSHKGTTQEWLAIEAKLGTQGAVGQYLRGVIPLNLPALLKICDVIGADPKKISPRLTSFVNVMKTALETAIQQEEEDGKTLKHPHRRAADFELVPADQADSEVGRIEYWDAKGSCGGGFLNYEQPPKGHLIKEATFFYKYGVKPRNLFAIYADGNSMADYIVDGDIVIFDKTKTTPIGGKIFLIDHPEGLRIKQLRRGIDGAWILESKNPDKRDYPDERIEPGYEELLKVCGQFVYRQGG